MAAKKPIVATRVNGTVEIISDGVNGLLIAPENAKEIEEKTELLINDCHLRNKLAEEAYKRVNEVFSIESCVRKTEKVYYRVWGIKENA
jgi:L-malate glycosyltransferase